MKRLITLLMALTAIALLAAALTACQEGEPKLQGPPTIDLARQRPALSLLGAQANDKVRAVAAGDVNGDGHLDIIVGAFNADGPQDERPASRTSPYSAPRAAIHSASPSPPATSTATASTTFWSGRSGPTAPPTRGPMPAKPM